MAFNRNRLSLARTRRGLTAKGLADRAQLAALTITRLEKGENEPDQVTLQRLAEVLEYPEGFFFRKDPPEIPSGAASFRGLTKMTAKERGAALSAGVLGVELLEWVEDRFVLPSPNLIDLSAQGSPEMAAVVLRQHWQLGERPIGNMNALLESHGIRLLSLSEQTKSVDAFSFRKDSKPYIFLNNFKSAEHSIFDAAHELGHLVLHRRGYSASETRAVEKEANQFASAFLMPRNDVRSQIRGPISASSLIGAKVRWRVSAMALAHRLWSVERLSDWQYKAMCIELTKRNYRTSEPNGIAREKSAVWSKVLAQLWSEQTTKAELAEDLALPLAELDALIWGLTGSPVERSTENPPALRVVK